MLLRHVRIDLHRACQQSASELAGVRCSDRLTEEHPRMRAVARPRALDGDWHALPLAYPSKRADRLPPIILVEVDREHTRLVVADKRIASDDPDALPPRAAEMRLENLAVKRQELAMWTVRALDPGFSAYAALPLMGACGRIADAPRFLVEVALRIHIAAHGEQTLKISRLQNKHPVLHPRM